MALRGLWRAGWTLMSFQRAEAGPEGGGYPWQAAVGFPPKVQGSLMEEGQRM